MAESGAGATAAYVKGQLYMLAIGDIQPNPNQPRKYFDEEGLAELTGSVTNKGVLQPILVRQAIGGHDAASCPPIAPGIVSPNSVQTPETLILVAGERRLKAAQNAGLTEIPALFTDDNPEEIALIENSLRQNLTAVEEAEAAGRLVSELNYTNVQLCKVLGKKPQTISNILSLNRLPAEIRDECRTNPTCSRQVLVEIAKKKQDRAMITLVSPLLTGIASLHTRLEKIDWMTFSTDDRRQIQEAFAALTDAFKAIVETDSKVPM